MTPSAHPVIPDPSSTLAAQLEQLQSGQRRAVLASGAHNLPAAVLRQLQAHRFQTLEIPEGVVIYSPKTINARSIKRAQLQGSLNQILGPAQGGMGPENKSQLPPNPTAVVAKSPAGTPVQETLASPAGVPQAAAQAAKVTPPGGSVQTQPPDAALLAREANLVREGIDVNRGSSTRVGLSPKGMAHANQIGQQVAAKGGVDSITSADSARSLQTSSAISRATGTPVQPTPALRSWGQGIAEGQPKKAAKPVIDKLWKNPTQVLPGQPLTDQPSESAQAFANRTLSVIANAMHNQARNPATVQLFELSSQGIKLVHAWVKAGCPEDFSVLKMPKLEDGDTGPPGEVDRLWPSPKGQWELKPYPLASAKAFDPGIYLGRHAETPVSTENYSKPNRAAMPPAPPVQRYQQMRRTQ